MLRVSFGLNMVFELRASYGQIFKTLRALGLLSRGRRIEIDPVCVLSPEDQLRIPMSDFNGTRKQYRLEAEKIVRRWIALSGVAPVNASLV